jgi:hypothetical protein
MGEQVDFGKFLSHHFPGAIPRSVVGNNYLKAGIIDLPKGFECLPKGILQVVIYDNDPY